MPILQSDVDLVINVAATVEFDAALDLSIELNTLGPQRILEFIHGCRKDPVLVPCLDGLRQRLPHRKHTRRAVADGPHDCSAQGQFQCRHL